MKKIIAISSLLMGALLLTGCGKQQENQPAPSQTVSTTAALQTYSNPKWGFTIKYPVEYKAQKDIEDASGFAFSIRKKNDPEEAKNNDGVCTNCAFKLGVILSFTGGSEGTFKTPEEWLENQKSIKMSYGQTTLSGKTAYTSTQMEPNRKTYFVFIKNGTAYDRYDLSVKENDSVAQELLAAFKFTR